MFISTNSFEGIFLVPKSAQMRILPEKKKGIWHVMDWILTAGMCFLLTDYDIKIIF